MLQTDVLHRSSTILCSTPVFHVKIADSLQEVEAALRLRFEVFNLEMHEGLQSSYESGFDSDVYDTFCDHLIVKETATGAVVGTYRLLTQQKAVEHIGFYSQNEFDLSGFSSLDGNLLEAGRSCVAKEYRSLAVINLLWSGIARYLELHDITHLFGCASFHTDDVRFLAAASSYFSQYHAAPPEFRVTPVEQCRMRLPFDAITRQEVEGVFRHFPPLIKGYLRLGAVVCGEPAYDKDFGTADILVLLNTERITSRYRERFIEAGAAV
jgi:putative hemolysin